jgi:hypothetical protein
MMQKKLLVLISLAISLSALFAADKESGFVPLFPEEGVPKGWVTGQWNDVSKPAPDAMWKVEKGVLHGGARGNWLMSEKEYSDFILEYEFRLGELGNSGCALRAPMKGDPAFDGMELQMADYRYNTNAKPSELTGGLYRAVAPKKQVYKPTQWNKYRIMLKGSKVDVVLNGEKILDLDLNDYHDTVKRHDDTDAPPLKDRPRKGHIGFQQLSRGGTDIEIRNARIKALE